MTAQAIDGKAAARNAMRAAVHEAIGNPTAIEDLSILSRTHRLDEIDAAFAAARNKEVITGVLLPHA